MQVNLRTRNVKTLAGDGVKAEQDYTGGRSGRAQRLNSPWDLAFDAQACHSRVNPCMSSFFTVTMLQRPSHLRGL